MDGEDRFGQGLDELDRYLFHLEEAALPRAIASFRAATAHTPEHLESWVALGFALDAADKPERAAAALRRAHEIGPEDEEVEVFVATLLCESGPEPAAMEMVERLAERQGVDLESLRSELIAADFPTDAQTLLLNGFLRARNFVRSRLEDLIAKRSRTVGGGGQRPNELDDDTDCAPFQLELQAGFEIARVPGPLREMAPWAVRLGVGDDVCRSILMEALSTGERSELHRAADIHAAAIHEWLDGLGDAMTHEASAFMYLLLGVEEGGPFEA